MARTTLRVKLRDERNGKEWTAISHHKSPENAERRGAWHVNRSARSEQPVKVVTVEWWPSEKDSYLLAAT